MKRLPILVLATTLPLCAAETKVSLEAVPGPVRTAIEKLVGKGAIRKTVREPGDHGGMIYEVSYTQNGRKYEAEISPKGDVLVVDEEIALSDAPKAVRTTVERQTAGGKVTKVEKATEGKKVFYEVEFRKGGSAEHELQVAPDGKVLKVE
jgi:hypothetical protein